MRFHIRSLLILFALFPSNAIANPTSPKISEPGRVFQAISRGGAGRTDSVPRCSG